MIYNTLHDYVCNNPVPSGTPYLPDDLFDYGFIQQGFVDDRWVTDLKEFYSGEVYLVDIWNPNDMEKAKYFDYFVNLELAAEYLLNHISSNVRRKYQARMDAMNQLGNPYEGIDDEQLNDKY